MLSQNRTTQSSNYVNTVSIAIGCIFTIGWFLSQSFYHLYPLAELKYSILTFCSACLYIYTFRRIVKGFNLHLWFIWIWLLFCHHIQFFFIIFLSHSNTRLLSVSIHFSRFLTSSMDQQVDISTNIMTIIFVCLLGFSIGVFMITKDESKVNKINQLQENKKNNNLIVDQILKSIDKKTITRILFIALVLSVCLLFIQYDFRIAAKQTANQLPFRLAGIIYNTNRLLIPFAYIFVIYVSQVNKWSIMARNASVFFVIHSTVYSVIATTRFLLPFTVLSLLLISYITNNIDRNKILLAIGFIILLPFFVFIVASLRSLREVGEIGSFANIPIAVEKLITDITTQSSGRSLWEASILYSFFRLNGSLTLFSFLSSGLAQYDISHIIQRLQYWNYNTDLLFKVDVLQYNLSDDIGISAGLTTCLYLISSSDLFLLLIFYILLPIICNYIYQYVIKTSNYFTVPKLVLFTIILLLVLISGKIDRIIDYIIFYFVLCIGVDRGANFLLRKRA